MQPQGLLKALETQGVDQVIQRFKAQKISLDTPAYYEALVDVALAWQIGNLETDDARTLLAILAAYPEATEIPKERLRLLSGLQDDDIFFPFQLATEDLENLSLVEILGDSYRLHPLTQKYVNEQFKSADRLREAVPHLVTAYRTPEIIATQTEKRGFTALYDDLRLTGVALEKPDAALTALERLYTLEEHKLRSLSAPQGNGLLAVQQLHGRAFHQFDDALCDDCAEWLNGKRHLAITSVQRYPADTALQRVLTGHTDTVKGVLADGTGRLLSRSKDRTLRLWSAQGEELRVLVGHTDTVVGALELKDGRLLSWAYDDGTLRLWSAQGEEQRVLTGHTDTVVAR